jgi:hypothetical protein
MITPTTPNRNTHVAILELSKKNNLAYFTLQDGVDVKQAWIMLLTVGIVALAAVGGGAGGWLVAAELWLRPDLSAAFSLLTAAVTGIPTGLFVLDRLLEAAAASYEAEMSERPDVPTGRSFSRAAVPGRTVPLSEHDKELLQVFSRRYTAMPVALRTLAIGEWEGTDSPFVFDWLPSKRAGIKRVQSLIVQHGLGSRDRRGGVTLNPDGEARVIQWADGIFEDESDD